MSSYQTFLEDKNVKAALIKRNASIQEGQISIEKLKSLDTQGPNLRQFTYREKELDANLDQLKLTNYHFVQYIYHGGQEMLDCEEYKKDQEAVNSCKLDAEKEKDKYLEILENHGLIK